MRYEFIGWCKGDNHDKVWVAIELKQSTWLTVWGRRGSKLQTKLVYCSHWQMQKLINTKQTKGYRGFGKLGLDQVYPDFESDLEKVALWSVLVA
jgi:predicted DNA-binding WGR domain protein